MNTKIKTLKKILIFSGLLILVSAISFLYEYSQIQDIKNVETTGVIIDKIRNKDGMGRWGDPYKIVIEYNINGNKQKFSTSRAVWHTFGDLDTIGNKVPLLYLSDGRILINKFTYLYPVTTTFLGLAFISLLSLLGAFLVPRSRFRKAENRKKQYLKLAQKRDKKLSLNRKSLLNRLHGWFAFIVLTAGLFALAIIIKLPWLGILSLVSAILLVLLLRKILVCPHCGNTLIQELRELEPNITNRTNWLVVRDYLAKGVPVQCQSCKKSLDEI